MQTCLFCKLDDGGFSSTEHIIPESLGNTEYVLNRGVVCDRCNNGPLAQVDKALCEFFPVTMRRTILGVKSKKGTVPHTRFITGRLLHVGEEQLRIDVHSPRDKKTFRQVERVGDQVKLHMEAKGGRKLTPRYCAELRAGLLKMGLEFVYWTSGADAFDEALDHVRDVVLGAPLGGVVGLVRKGDPEHRTVTVVHDVVSDDAETKRLLVQATIYGVTMLTDSRSAKLSDGLTGVDELVFTAEDLEHPAL